MSEIQFMVKPDWVSWEDVCDCISKANTVNDKKGFHMLFADIKPDTIRKKMEDGVCFVALYNGKVVGTTSYRVLRKKTWWVRGKVIYHCYDAVLPEFRGTDVYIGINKLKYDSVKATGLKIQQFYTAEQNRPVIKLNLRYGFKLISFRPTTKGAKYYSVSMVKWDDGCPYPDWFLKIMYNLSKWYSRTFYNPDNTSKIKS